MHNCEAHGSYLVTILLLPSRKLIAGVACAALPASWSTSCALPMDIVIPNWTVAYSERLSQFLECHDLWSLYIHHHSNA